MRWSKSHIPTLREAPQEAEVISHQLMLRAGMIRKLASGIYSFLPLGWRAIHKLEALIREEMAAAGAQEVLLPVLQPAEIWQESGRWQVYGKEMGRFKDRHENDFCLQPTSEEAIVDLVRRDFKSYRDLPQNLFQIQTKFRDEVRPRFGLMRGREFIMKDAYSFDLTETQALESYEQMRVAYRKIFSRSGLEFRAVDADTGTIGGQRSEEFTVLAKHGEDEIVACSSCDYGANQEKAVAKTLVEAVAACERLPKKIETPQITTIAQLAKAFSRDPKSLIKTMIAVAADKTLVVVLLRGSDDLHELKLQRFLKDQKGLEGVRLMNDEELKALGLPKGSLGPHQFKHRCLIVADEAVNLKSASMVGANEDGFHFDDVVLERDAKVELQGVLRVVREGETCVRCQSALKAVRGIEVGHVFYLGTKYSKSMKLQVVDEKNQLRDVEMGCYGIGVGRTIAAAIEQNFDADGIIWPLSLAPFEVSVIALGEGEPTNKAEEFYRELLALKIDVLFDDRVMSPGAKMKDNDLIGTPIQLVIGSKGLQAGSVECKLRRGQQKSLLPFAEVISWVQQQRANLTRAA